MPVSATDHIVILVKDIESAITNWQNLGCALSHRATIDAVSIHQAFFLLDDGTFIELIAPSSEDSPLTKTLESRGEGIHTLAMEVTDLEQSIAAMQKKGVQVMGAGTDQTFVHPKSANGVRIQLWEKQRPHRWQANPQRDQRELGLMTLYNISEAEAASGSLDPEKLDAIAKDFNDIGFAVVGGLVSTETCDKLLNSMLEDVAAIRTRDTLTPHEKHTAPGHLQLGPRRYADFVGSDLVANPILESVIEKLLGEGAWLGFYNGNVNCPESGTQPLHFDRPFAWKTETEAVAAGQSWPPPSITVSCSVALSPISEASGATEIYPGTHKEIAVTKFAAGEQPIHHPELVKKWEPSAHMAIPAGGVCFRDPRMWHRGVPNPSETPRPMLALTYHSGLAKHQRGTLVDLTAEEINACNENPALKRLDDGSLGDGRLIFHESARAVFEQENQHKVYRNARFIESPAAVNHFKDAHLLGGARVSESGEISPYPER